MTEENLNKFIDKSFEENLFSAVKPDFAENVMRQVELSKRFQAEDKKTFRAVNFLSVFLALFITGAGMFLAYLISTSGKENTEGDYVPGAAETIEKWIVKFFALVGLNLTESTILYMLLVVVIIVLFFVVDRYFSGNRAITRSDSGKI